MPHVADGGCGFCVFGGEHARAGGTAAAARHQAGTRTGRRLAGEARPPKAGRKAQGHARRPTNEHGPTGDATTTTGHQTAARTDPENAKPAAAPASCGMLIFFKNCRSPMRGSFFFRIFAPCPRGRA